MKRYHIALILIYFCSCKENDKKNFETTPPQSISHFTIEVARDTFYSDEYVRGLATLNRPFFKKPTSKIIVVLEADENQPLKKDLSNEYNIPVQGFHNLAFDTINQKWFKSYDFKKTSVFGKKYKNQGQRMIRGYIMEYITKEPPIDSIYSNDSVKKYYFEKKIYVKDSLPLK